MSLGISGIGAYNPYMSGLGALGLGAGGSFASYADPSMMGMGAMMGFPGGMGMMGMYNPSFMAQMNQVYQDMEKSQLRHSSAMHEIMMQNKTDAYKAEDMALFRKAMEDASLNTAVVNLAEKIREGDADGICEEFDRMKIALYQKYNSYLKENSDRLDPKESVNNIIEMMYSEIISKKTGEQVSLRNDIKRYGETAFNHGFNEKFFGKSDYHKKYTEETLSYLFGTRIDNKGGKDRMEKIGGGFGRAAEAGTAAAAGYGAGLGLAGIASIVSPGIRKSLSTAVVKDEAGKIVKDAAGKAVKESNIGNWLNKAGKFGKWAAIAVLAGDIIWQCSRD